MTADPPRARTHSAIRTEHRRRENRCEQMGGHLPAGVATGRCRRGDGTGRCEPHGRQQNQTNPRTLAVMNGMTMCAHQYEEYIDPGYFPGMVNVGIFKSNHPRSYSYNPNSAMCANAAAFTALSRPPDPEGEVAGHANRSARRRDQDHRRLRGLHGLGCGDSERRAGRRRHPLPVHKRQMGTYDATDVDAPTDV